MNKGPREQAIYKPSQEFFGPLPRAVRKVASSFGMDLFPRILGCSVDPINKRRPSGFDRGEGDSTCHPGRTYPVF